MVLASTVHSSCLLQGALDWRAMAGADLVLDQQVRDWVVVPLTLCILLMMVLRQYATKVSRPAYMAHQAALKRHPNCCILLVFVSQLA